MEKEKLLTKFIFLKKHYLQIFFIFINLFFSCLTNYSHGSSLNYLKKTLNKKDYELIKNRCFIEKTNITAKCENLIAIKLLKINNVNINNQSRLNKEAFLLLLSASEKGNPEATKNLAWLYASGIGVEVNLNKSSELYSNYQKKINKLSSEIIFNEPIIINKKIENNYNNPYLRRAFSIMSKINLYYNIKLNNPEKYLSTNDYKNAKSIMNKIIIASNLSRKEVKKIREEVNIEQDIVVKLMEYEIKNFDKKHILEVKNLIKELSEIKL